MDMITLDEFKSAPKGIFRIQISDVAGKELWCCSSREEVLHIDTHLFEYIVALAKKEGICNEIRYAYYVECEACGSFIVDLNAVFYLLDELELINEMPDSHENTPNNPRIDHWDLYDIRCEICDHVLASLDLNIDERIEYFLETLLDDKTRPYEATFVNECGKLCGYTCDRLAVVKMPKNTSIQKHSCIVRQMINNHKFSR